MFKKEKTARIPMVFAILDQKAAAFLAPFTTVNEATATRMLAQSLFGESQFAQNPADYTLFKVGEFDDETGNLLPCTPEAIINGLTLKAQIEAEEGGNDDA